MASTTYSLHPSSNSLPVSVTTGSSTDAKYFYFIPKHYMISLSALTVPLYMQNSTSGYTQYRWNNVCNYSTGTTERSGTNRAANLISDFNKSRQILCVRVQLDKTNTKYTIEMPSISATGTIQTLSTVSAGDKIDNANMAALKTYLDGYCTGTNIGTSYTLADITEDAPIDNSNLSSYVNKANALPHVSGLSAPSEGASITAAYYNNIVNKVKP